MNMRKHLASTRLYATAYVTISMLFLLTFISNAYAHKTAPVKNLTKQATQPIEILAAAAPGHHHNGGQSLTSLIDGNLNTRWMASHFPQEITLDLGNPQMISSARMAFETKQPKKNYRYTIAISLDSINWIQVIKHRKYDATLWTSASFSPLNARYIKINITTVGHAHTAAIHDIEVYGEKSTVSNRISQGMRKITLSWLPSAGDIQGYLVYYGASANSASAQISDIPVNTPESNSQTLSIQYDSWLDLNLSPGDNVCFRVKAYSGLGLSKSSKAICSGI